MTITHQTKQYIAHLVPTRVQIDSKTSEFKTALNNETPNSEITTTYIRGKQIKGKSVHVETLTPYIISQGRTKNELDEQENNNTETLVISDLIPIQQIINYEREGNEERLQMELSKFNEYLDLTNTINGD